MADAEQTLGGRYALPRDAAMTIEFVVKQAIEAGYRKDLGPESISMFVSLSPLLWSLTPILAKFH